MIILDKLLRVETEVREILIRPFSSTIRSCEIDGSYSTIREKRHHVVILTDRHT